MTKLTTRNILRVYRNATPQEKAQGLAWYNEAQKACRDMSVKHKVPMHIVTAVCAALSPSNKWARNLIDTDTIIAAYLRGDAIETVKVSTYNAMKEKAWGILSESPTTSKAMTLLNGQKIISFFECIMGMDNCCIDGHAFNIVTNKRIPLNDAKTGLTKRKYKELQGLYRRAAKQEGIAAYEMQAITWVAWRNAHNIT